jgi:hypothetical protein
MVSKCQNGFIHCFLVVDKKKFEFEFHHLLNDLESSKFPIYHVLMDCVSWQLLIWDCGVDKKDIRP